MNEETVLYEVRGPLAFLTLNRPDKLNAINAAMIGAVHRCMDRAEADEQVRLIVLQGAGRAFSAGFDLEEEYPKTSDDPLAEEIINAQLQEGDRIEGDAMEGQDELAIRIIKGETPAEEPTAEDVPDTDEPVDETAPETADDAETEEDKG